MLESCTFSPAATQDPSFHVQTALLWVRSDNHIQRESTAIPLPREPPLDLASIQPDNGLGKKSGIGRVTTFGEDEPDLGLLPLHQDRLAAAAKAFGWLSMPDIRFEIERHMRGQSPRALNSVESYKVRVMMNKAGGVKVDSTVLLVEPPSSHSTPSLSSFIPISLDQAWKTDKPHCEVYLDRQPTRPSSLTTHKTTHRCVYTSARERLDMTPSTSPTSKEVLLYNPSGEVIEASFCTVYFKRNDIWITPASICGPNLGVSRRLAIENDLCKEGSIDVCELRRHEELWLSNAVRGFFKGVLMTDAKGSGSSAGSKQVMCAKLTAGVVPDSTSGRVMTGA